MIETAGEDEQIIAQAVDVAGHKRMHIHAGIGKIKHFALGPAAHGAGHMGHARGHRPARQDECALGGHRSVEAVDSLLEGLDLGFVDRGGWEIGRQWLIGIHLRRGGGEVGAETEHHFIDADEETRVLLGSGDGADMGMYQSDVGIKLIHSTVGVDTWRIFSHARPAHKSCGATIAGARVEHTFLHSCKCTPFFRNFAKIFPMSIIINQ